MTALYENLDPTLAEALLRFTHAEEPDVIERWVAWPEMAEFVRATTEFHKAVVRFANNMSVDEDARRWSAARYLLRSSFISPNHPDVDLVEHASWRPVADGELGELQTRVRRAAAELAAGPHRSLQALQHFFAEDRRLRWPCTGTARVVVPTRAISGTLVALESLDGTDGVTWDVCSLAEAKRKPGCDVTVVPGSPEFFEGWRTEESLRHRRVSWLFNAPMSRHVVAIAWAGSRRLMVDRFEPYPGANTIDGRRWVDEDPDEVPVDEPAEVPSLTRPRPGGRSDVGEETVECIDFELPGGQWISFGVDNGPLARRIDDDSEFAVVVESGVKSTALRRGNTLVILSSTDDRELRDSLCKSWLDTEPNRPAFDDAQRTVASYKSAARRYLARSEAITELRRLGLPEQYVRSQFIRSHPRSPAMAPQRHRNFVTIAQAAGWTPPEHAWDQIEALRAGYKHAGREIARLLTAAVAADLSWIDHIDRREIARIAVDGVGTVTLAPIVGISPTRSLRGINELGEVVRG